jgi:hypothetical protein
MSELFNNVKVGDTVHYSTPQGQYGKGKVVIKHESGSHVVINRGKGQPQVVNDKNYVKHERGGKVIGALLSKLAAHDKYLKGVASTKASNAVAKAVSPYKKVGDPQMNASKAFGWTKTNEMRNPSGPYGGHPYDWDPELRKAIFAGIAKKTGKPKGPKDSGRPYVPTKSGPPPRRGTPSLQGEDASEAEGRGARVAKTKNKKKKLHEVSSGTLASYVSKAIADRKKLAGMADQAQRIHTPERAKYFMDKAAAKAAKRSKGIKAAVGKIASNLPSEPLKAHADSEGSKHGGWSGMSEGNPDRYADQSWARELADKSPNMSQGAGKKAPGHYLMKGGRTLSGPHEPHEAVKAYKGLSDSKGVKIVHHTNEGVDVDVTTQMLSEDKVKQAAQKAIVLAKKAKGNKHVDTEPSLDIVDKGTHGPIQADDEGGHNNA